MDDPRPARSRRAQLTARDRQLLAFAAEHRLVLAGHIEALLDVSAASAYARLRRLTRAGYLRHENVFHRQPGCYQVTRKGMALIGSGYSSRPVNVGEYQHDVGLAWLWLAARAGVLGPMREVIGERHMRSRDASADGRSDRDPFGVRLGGYGPGGRERLHYPDLLLVTPSGKRIAVELELSAKGRARREKILSGYAADGRIDGVLYLVEQGRDGLARAIRESARRSGIGSIVHVRQFRWGESSRGKSAVQAAERHAGRTGGRADPGRIRGREGPDRGQTSAGRETRLER